MNPVVDQRVRRFMKIHCFAPDSFFGFLRSCGRRRKIRISVTNYNMSYLAAGVAAKQGFFKEEGARPRNRQDELQRRHVSL